MNRTITRVSLNICDNQWNQINLDLSPMQVKAVCKILGIQPASRGEYTCFSDQGIQTLFQMKGNPLNLQEAKAEE